MTTRKRRESSDGSALSGYHAAAILMAEMLDEADRKCPARASRQGYYNGLLAAACTHLGKTEKRLNTSEEKSK